MAKKTVDLENRTVTFEVGDETRVFELDKVSDEMKTQLMLHGASQKIGDSYAGAKSAVEGSDMTVEEYTLNAVETGIDQLYNNDWSIRTGGAGGPRVTDLARAIAEATNADVQAVAEKLADTDADTKKALQADPAIKPILARIRAERAAEKAKEAEESTDAGESKLAELF